MNQFNASIIFLFSKAGQPVVHMVFQHVTIALKFTDTQTQTSVSFSIFFSTEGSSPKWTFIFFYSQKKNYPVTSLAKRKLIYFYLGTK